MKPYSALTQNSDRPYQLSHNPTVLARYSGRHWFLFLSYHQPVPSSDWPLLRSSHSSDIPLLPSSRTPPTSCHLRQKSPNTSDRIAHADYTETAASGHSTCLWRHRRIS